MGCLVRFHIKSYQIFIKAQFKYCYKTMDETQKYLNQILKKRLGSVLNYGSSSKTANTVTRLPKQQQKLQNMPTVFRKKHQTVYIQNTNKNSYYSHQQQAQSQCLSMKQTNNKGLQHMEGYNNNQIPQQNMQQANQRVQYMLISKRIQNKKQDQFISPTVDVTKYSKSYKEINNTQKQPHYKSNFIRSENDLDNHKGRKMQFQSHRNMQNYEWKQQQQVDKSNDSALLSKTSSQRDKSKRKKIFGAQ